MQYNSFIVWYNIYYFHIMLVFIGNINIFQILNARFKHFQSITVLIKKTNISVVFGSETVILTENYQKLYIDFNAHNLVLT